MGDDASQPSQAAQDTPQTAQLREFVAELAARVAAMEAARDRQHRVRELLDDAGYPPEPPPRRRRPAHRRQGRSHLRVIPGGMAALVPLAVHAPAAAAAVPAAHVWLSRRAWPRWAVAAVALGLAGATAMPTAADTVHPHAVVIRMHRHRGNAEDEEAALANLLCGRGLTAAGSARPPC